MAGLFYLARIMQVPDDMATKIVILNNTNYEVALDEEDVERVQARLWFVQNPTSYVIRCSYKDHTRFSRATGWGTLTMGRFLLNVTDRSMDVDHIDNNPFNNTKANLRIVTQSQNCMNRKKQQGTYTSKYKGVIYARAKKKWRARITANREVIWGGYFLTEREAALKANELLRKHHGEFAVLNDVA